MCVYADDTAFIVEGDRWDDVDDIILKLISIATTWCRRNGMSLCERKTEIVNFYRLHRSKNVKLQQWARESARYLGLILDIRLSFQQHFMKLRPKMLVLTAALKAMAKFVPIVHRRAFFSSICQNIFWPIFYIHVISDSLLSNIRSLYYNAARALCRAPKFVDFETIHNLAAIEPFGDLVTRHTITKVTTMTARAAFYKSHLVSPFLLNVNLLDTQTKPTRPKQTRYPLRSKDPRPTAKIYRKPILSEVLAEKISPLCNLNQAPWTNGTFSPETMHDAGLAASEHLQPVELSRRCTIKKSFYFEFLKPVSCIKTEISLISKFIESRRYFWNYQPNIGKFDIRYDL